MVLKKLNKKNMKEIINLHKEAIFPLWKKLGRKYNIKEIKEYIEDTLKRGVIFGYFAENKLNGCAGTSIDKKHKVGEIRLVLVNPKFQKKGIGKKLIKEIERYAKNKRIKELNLHILVKNKAIGFYNKLNYRKYAYIMQKKLK